MLLQLDGTVMTIIAVLVATILLGLCLYLASNWIVSKRYATDHVVMIFVTALVLVLVVPIVAGYIGQGLSLIGGLIASIRNTPNQLMQMVAIVQFLLFLIIVRLLMKPDDWKDVLWISLIGLFLLYLLYTALPELLIFGPAA
jgi:hypothetical protein